MSPNFKDRSNWQVRVVAPSQLTDRDVSDWNSLRAAHPEYDSPLLSPAFARLAGACRPDARVGLISDERGLAAVLAFLIRPSGLGRPIGAPFSDYSGPVVRANLPLSLSQIVSLAGLAGYRTQSLLDPWNRFAAERTGGTLSQLVRMQGLSDGDYLEQRRAEHPKRFKNFRRLESLMRRAGHEVHLRWGPLDGALRDRLYGFKSAQYRESGLVDLTFAPRARALLDAVEASPNGFQASVWSGDELVSADFGFREGTAFHPWIAAYNPEFALYSPGNLLQKQVIENMGAMGLDTYDLAEGHDHYKKYFTNSGRMIYSADVVATGRRGWHLSAQGALWRAAGVDQEGSPARRLMRRADHAAVCFDSAAGRASDLLMALRKRGVSATVKSGHSADAD